MLHHFKIIPFAAGLAVGLFLLFFYTTPPIVVYTYPNPKDDGTHTRVYKDKNAACYSYSSKEVSCDANEGTLRPYPIQS